MTTERKLEVLIVEDNAMDALLIRRFLEHGKVKHAVSEVNDGEEALEFLFRRGSFGTAPIPNLIILDLGLPKIGGQEVLRRIKKSPELRQIPVVVLTAQITDPDAIRKWKLNEHCYVNKWFNMTDFLTLIKAVEDYWAEIDAQAES